MNKYIAPIIITIVTIGYGIGMGLFLYKAVMQYSLPILLAILVLMGPIVISVLIIVVLIERIKEIKGGEEDVASKY